MFPQSFNNGHFVETLHSKGLAFISKRVSFRHFASFDNTLQDSYRKYRFTHSYRKHWLAIHLQLRSYSGYFFDFYGLLPLNPSILNFLRRACSVWEYNLTQLQGWTSTVCGEYCCLFALYMDRGYTPRQFVSPFDAATFDRQISRLCASDFGPLHTKRCGGQGCTASMKGNYTTSLSPFSSCHSFDTH